jgi:hypothetical protein
MAASDAQHPPRSGSNVTGVVRLNQNRLPIDHRTYFRNEFFDDLPWVPGARAGTEGTVVPFEVIVDGESLGEHRLRVDYNPAREADQNNVTTVLHWDTLGPTLAATNYTDYFVVTEKSPAGYRLTITSQLLDRESFVSQ